MNSETSDVRQLLASAVETLGEGNDQSWHYWMCLFLSNLWELQFGDSARGDELADLLDQFAERSDDGMARAHASEIHALRAHFAGESEDARIHLVGALGHYRQMGLRASCFAHCLDHIALWTLDDGDASHATSLLGSAEALRQDHVGAPAPAAERLWHDQAKETARKELGDAGFELTLARGRDTQPEHAADLASAVLDRAHT